MKSLNRTLSLVLVLVMVFGLFGVASAATFTDDSTIQYKEAVNVMTGIGAINGYTDGTFAPKGTITREEAAKLVTYAILGADIAKTLTVSSTSFKDVEAGRWSAPFISYCVSKGIINGIGDGKFDPEGKVTGHQLAKMLLCSAGYGKQGEFTGEAWSLTVAILANKLDVFFGSKATSFSTAATREEAALYVFNTLTKVESVKYSKDEADYTKQGANSTIGKLVYGLSKATVTQNGVTGYTWQNRLGKDVSDFVASELVIGTSYAGKTVSDMSLKSTANKYYVAELDTSVKYFYNGNEVTATTESTTAGDLFVSGNKLWVSNGSGTTDVEYAIRGAIVNFVNLDTDEKAEKVSIVEKKVTKLLTNPITRTVNGVLQVNVGAATGSLYVEAKYVKGYENLKKDDIVLYVTMGDYTTIEKATAAPAGKYTAKSALGGYTVGDAVYYNAALSGATSIDTMTFGDTFVVYTSNDGGYAVGFAAGAAVQTTCAVVLDAGTVSAIGQAPVYQAQLLLTDGTQKIVTTDASWTAYKDKLVSYTVTTAGAYKYVSSAAALSDGLVTKNALTINSALDVYADGKTIFINRVGNGTTVPYTYTQYVGYMNVPTLIDTTIQVVKNASDVATIVFIDGATTTDAAGVYLLSTTNGTAYVNGTTVYTYPAIVNGVVGTINTDAVVVTNIFDDGVGYYANVVIPGTGVIADPTVDYTKAATAKINFIGDGIIKIGSTTYTYNDQTVVHYIDSTVAGTPVTKTTVSALTATSDVNFVLKTGSTTAITDIYFYFIP